MIVTLPHLSYLNDRPIFPEDRRYAAAYMRGGIAEERKERKKVKEEKREEGRRRHKAYQAWLKKCKEEVKEEKRLKRLGLWKEPEPRLDD